MPFEFLDDESSTSGEPLDTPVESLADDTCSESTSTMRDTWRPETSYALFVDLALVSSNNHCPSDSPYDTPIFTILVGSGRVPYTIQQGLLKQSPQWAEKCKSKPWGNKIELPDVDEDIGHSVVHYLYTGNYQTLKTKPMPSKAADNDEDPTATSEELGAPSLLEYRRSVRLYCVARTYGLVGLKNLALYRIDNPQGGISIWNVLSIAEEAYEKLPDDEVWFTGYLRRKLEAALRVDNYLLKKKTLQDRIGKVKKFDQALMSVIAEIYTERAEHGNRAEGMDKDPVNRHGTMPADTSKVSEWIRTAKAE